MKKSTENYSLENSAHVLSYRAHQERAANLQTQLNQLSQLIQGKSDEVAAAKANIIDISHLAVEREDLLADIALGKAGPNELCALDEKIAEQRKQQQSIAAKADEVSQAAEQVIAGLRRKIAPIESELQAMAETESRLLSKVVIEYAESLGAEYAEKAMELKELFFRLMGVDGLLRNSGIRKAGISSHTVAGMCIPAFNLATVAPHEMRAWPGNLCYFPTFPTSDVSQAGEQEKLRLMAAGIEIHPV